jgi:hypothetical protein
MPSDGRGISDYAPAYEILQFTRTWSVTIRPCQNMDRNAISNFQNTYDRVCDRLRVVRDSSAVRRHYFFARVVGCQRALHTENSGFALQLWVSTFPRFVQPSTITFVRLSGTSGNVRWTSEICWSLVRQDNFFGILISTRLSLATLKLNRCNTLCHCVWLNIHLVLTHSHKPFAFL